MPEIDELMQEASLLYDHDLSGGINTQGEINQVWNKDALNNAIKIWLASLSGEIIRDPYRGGYLRKFISKPMTEIDQDDLEMAIRDGFSQDFTPFMQIIDLSVTPLYEKRRWKIALKAYSIDFKILTEISEEIKARI